MLLAKIGCKHVGSGIDAVINILVVTTRDIYRAGGERTLMEAKYDAMSSRGIGIEYLSFRRDRTEGVGIYSTYSLIFGPNYFYRLIENKLKATPTSIVVISGVWLYCRCTQLMQLKEKYGFKLILDYQGATEELVEFTKSGISGVISSFVFSYLKSMEKKMLSMSFDLIEVVSNGGVEFLSAHPGNNRYFVAPCGIDRRISARDHQKYREKWRKKLDIRQGKPAIVYAGKVDAWQNLAEILQFFEKSDSEYYFFVPSHVVETLLDGGVPRHRVRSLVRNDYREALCAFDYGVLFRDSNVTNRVAWPNKFSEYLNSRLAVLITDRENGFYSSDLESAGHLVIVSPHEGKLPLRVDKDDVVLHDFCGEISYELYIPKLIEVYREILDVNEPDNTSAD